MTLPAAVRRVRARMDSGAESGVTLIELLIAVMIMGLAFVGILAGIGAVFRVTSYHRRTSTAETVLRAYAEALEDPFIEYIKCPTTGVIRYPTSAGTQPQAPANDYRRSLEDDSIVVPVWKRLGESQREYRVEIIKVEVQTGSTVDGGPVFGPCTTAAQDLGAQRLTLTTSSPSGPQTAFEKVVIVKRDATTDITPTTSTTVP